eukprot:605923-Rhodomonas_salina.1
MAPKASRLSDFDCSVSPRCNPRPAPQYSLISSTHQYSLTHSAPRYSRTPICTYAARCTGIAMHIRSEPVTSLPHSTARPHSSLS